MDDPSSSEGLEALRAGRAFVDLSSWWMVLVGGAGARGWLNDLLTADIGRLQPGRARRSLLLSSTGRIRADVTIALVDGDYMMVQDPIQPAPIDLLLEPYVLSADVQLVNGTGSMSLFAFPGGNIPPTSGHSYEPSCLGIGADIVGGGEDRTALRANAAHLVEAGPESLEAWRIERGAARFGVDLQDDSLPHEAGLDGTIDYRKGCFLGQEAVAKVRNLGHPPFAILGGLADESASAGDDVLSGEEVVGSITSAAKLKPGRTAVIVRVKWKARDSRLESSSGARLRSLRLASGPG